jgi:hypothetical protein
MLSQLGSGVPFWGVTDNPDDRTRRNTYNESYNKKFNEYKRQAYGDAEAPPAVLEQLRRDFAIKSAGDTAWTGPTMEANVRALTLDLARNQRKRDYLVADSKRRRGADDAPTAAELELLNFGNLSPEEEKAILSGKTPPPPGLIPEPGEW